MNWLLLLAQITPLPPLPPLPPMPALNAPAPAPMPQATWLNQNTPVIVIRPDGTRAYGTSWSTQTPGTIGGGTYYKELKK